MKPTNLLFLFSDQHTRDMTGCYGHSMVQTPHIDSLAERGTRFTSAYTNCPICVPARASLATGRYVHQIGNWDNAFPYDGSVPSWHHRLRDQGFRVESIGKLHFRGQGSDHGFSHETEPLNVVDGIGDVLGCIRDNPPFRDKRLVASTTLARVTRRICAMTPATPTTPVSGWPTMPMMSSRGPCLPRLFARTRRILRQMRFMRNIRWIKYRILRNGIRMNGPITQR